MDKSVERLAAALRDCVEPPGRAERTAALADALQDCLDKAVESGAREGSQAALERVMSRLDRMDTTLRLMWKQLNMPGVAPVDN